VRNWYEYLKKGLLAHGFHQSYTDSCLYIRDDCIMVVYTDDCLLFARNDKTIDNILTSLSQTYMLEDQGMVTHPLGIRITKDPSTKQMHMTQLGLIESILTDLGLLHDSNTKDTPALGVLHPWQEPWNYFSLIWKLNYLAQNTRPGKNFAVHQFARFSTQPTALHELAVK
jgi:hypothetical protein